MDRGYRTLITAFIFMLCTQCYGLETETTEFEFKVFGVGHDDYEGLYYRTGGLFEPLEFHRTHRSSQTYQYKGPITFRIYVRNPHYVITNPHSKPFIKISQSTVATGAKRQLIVFAASPTNREVSRQERRFTLYHIDDSIAAFPRNSIVVVNTTRTELYGRIGDSQVSLPRGHSEAIPYSSGGSGSTTPIAFALETKSGPKLVMSNDLKISDNRRVVLILEPPRRPGSLRIAVRILSESAFPEDRNDATN